MPIQPTLAGNIACQFTPPIRSTIGVEPLSVIVTGEGATKVTRLLAVLFGSRMSSLFSAKSSVKVMVASAASVVSP